MVRWPAFAELVAAHRRFVVTTHIRPDGDAVGSAMAMAGILRSLGKEVLLATGFSLPRNLRFLDPENRIKQVGVDVTPAEIETYEVLMVLDTSAWAQLGAMADVIRATRLKKLVIDHHVSNDDLGAELFKDSTAEATGRLVVDAADALGATLTAEVAAAAFVAVATDTGWYRFGSTQSGTYRLAARLMEAGAVPDQLFKALYENDSLGRLRLRGRALGRTVAERDGRLIYTWLELADFAECGAVPSDSEDIINETLTVGGTQVAVILVEQPTGGFKISFRSRSNVDCSAVASRFGGGGHRKAAGAFIPDALEIARSQALDAVRAVME